MANHIIELQLFPGTSGNVWQEPAALTQPTNDRYGIYVTRYKDTSTKDPAGFMFVVPPNYVGTPVFYVDWTTTATSGNAVWDCDYSSISPTGSMDPSADEEALSVTTAAPGASYDGKQSTMAATAGNFSAGDIVQGNLSRDGAGSDTIAADLEVLKFYFQYADA